MCGKKLHIDGGINNQIKSGSIRIGGIDMYLIVKHSFDSLENHNPEYTEVIGYIKDELDADSWIESQGDKEQYKGWNGKMYPYYTKQKIEKITL